MNYYSLPSSSRERDSVTQGIQVGWAHSLCLSDLPCYLQMILALCLKSLSMYLWAIRGDLGSEFEWDKQYTQ